MRVQKIQDDLKIFIGRGLVQPTLRARIYNSQVHCVRPRADNWLDC